MTTEEAITSLSAAYDLMTIGEIREHALSLAACLHTNDQALGDVAAGAAGSQQLAVRQADLLRNFALLTRQAASAIAVGDQATSNSIVIALAIVGERGRELVNLPRGSQVIPNHRTEGILNQRGERPSPGKDDRILNVTIHGASGDPHVRELVRQGVQEAIADMNTSDRRGGFGQRQLRWNNQKA